MRLENVYDSCQEEEYVEQVNSLLDELKEMN